MEKMSKEHLGIPCVIVLAVLCFAIAVSGAAIGLIYNILKSKPWQRKKRKSSTSRAAGSDSKRHSL